MKGNILGKALLLSIVLSFCLGANTNVIAGQEQPSTQALQDKKAINNSEYADMNWSWPTTGTTITEEFGDVGWRFHKGIDIGVRLEPVYSVAAGVIIQSGTYSDGTEAMTIRHNDRDPDTDERLITRYLHLVKNSQNYNTGDHIGQYVDIATSGNTGDVAYHLHFDVNNVDQIYPEDHETIDPMLFYPQLSFSIAHKNVKDSKQELENINCYEYFFDKNVQEYVGQEKFDKWFESQELEDRTMTNLKTEFSITDQIITELTTEKVRETELEIWES
ncbi:M23 family metallopeptidase [Bacillaceae bacterium SIJ1]|uniref:M23 family metallopeptidase n=1 Tax=Litoribacterium kuwaitense TaxID=1398745 RepID=UPI0013ED2EE4|nr:M23 family metallopeptidase [Litoribacterium kuwaitense]NGP44978.1 M23 family metallopeptidase [Litoribacterium kuwaitense]